MANLGRCNHTCTVSSLIAILKPSPYGTRILKCFQLCFFFTFHTKFDCDQEAEEAAKEEEKEESEAKVNR